jgi:hypothetical protein
MASLQDIRDGIAAVVTGAIPGISVYADVPSVNQVPAMVVMPSPKPSATFDGAFGRGLDTWYFDLYVLVPDNEATSAQTLLDSYLTGNGPQSLRLAFYNTPGLGLDDDTDAMATGIEGYGGKFVTAGIQQVGAVLKLTVRTPGK